MCSFLQRTSTQVPLPPWGVFIAIMLTMASIFFIPAVAFLKYFGFTGLTNSELPAVVLSRKTPSAELQPLYRETPRSKRKKKQPKKPKTLTRNAPYMSNHRPKERDQYSPSVANGRLPTSRTLNGEACHVIKNHNNGNIGFVWPLERINNLLLRYTTKYVMKNPFIEYFIGATDMTSEGEIRKTVIGLRKVIILVFSIGHMIHDVTMNRLNDDRLAMDAWHMTSHMIHDVTRIRKIWRHKVVIGRGNLRVFVLSGLSCIDHFNTRIKNTYWDSMELVFSDDAPKNMSKGKRQGRLDSESLALDIGFNINIGIVHNRIQSIYDVNTINYKHDGYDVTCTPRICHPF